MNQPVPRSTTLAGESPTRAPSASAPREHRRVQSYALLMLVDTIVILAGFKAASFFYPIGRSALELPVIVLPIYWVVALYASAYSIQVLLVRTYSVTRSTLALGISALAILLMAFYTKSSAEFSRVMFTIGIACALVGLAIGRRLAFAATQRLCGPNPVSVVVILDGGEDPQVAHAHVVDAQGAGLHPDAHDPYALDAIARYLHNADRVIVSSVAERRAAWALVLKGTHIDGEVIDPSITELGVLGTRRYGNTGSLIVSTSLLTLRSRIMKRSFDMVCAVAALVILSPLLLLVAIAIKLEDGGPILFVQRRLGRGNQFFDILKFRSMSVSAGDAAGARSTGIGDERVTRVGRLIRKTSIDELPQLINIVRNEMSVVGPRPHALGSLAGERLFWEIDQRYWHRHALKPGLTGLAQVRGLRGATDSESDLIGRLQADLEYLDGWSITRDILILFATLRVVVHAKAF